jgi:hypothetical protein
MAIRNPRNMGKRKKEKIMCSETERPGDLAEARASLVRRL